MATGEDGRRALELANALLLAGYRDQTVTIPVDRAAYDALLGDLRRLAAGGDRRKRKPSWERETVLGALPEGS